MPRGAWPTGPHYGIRSEEIVYRSYAWWSLPDRPPLDLRAHRRRVTHPWPRLQPCRGGSSPPRGLVMTKALPTIGEIAARVDGNGFNGPDYAATVIREAIIVGTIPGGQSIRQDELASA